MLGISSTDTAEQLQLQNEQLWSAVRHPSFPFLQQILNEMEKSSNSPTQPYSASTALGSSSAQAPYSLPSLPIVFVISWVYLNLLTNCADSLNENPVCIFFYECAVIYTNDGWFSVIIAAYVFGITAFVYTLKSWTYSEESLYWVRISLEAWADREGKVQPFY